MKLDILAIAAHPDDAELGCGGTLIKHIKAGYKVGILDLTEGEMGTRGSVEERYKESARAAEIMGVSVRDNLQFRDTWFTNDQEHRLKLIARIRYYRPDIILANAPTDRHPDHGRAATLVKESAWLSGLKKIETSGPDGKNQEPWRPRHVFHYIQYQPLKPDFLVNIKGELDLKMKAVLAYTSQFYDPQSAQPDTLISRPEFLDLLRARVYNMGSYGLIEEAEGFITDFTPSVNDLFHLV